MCADAEGRPPREAGGIAPEAPLPVRVHPPRTTPHREQPRIAFDPRARGPRRPPGRPRSSSSLGLARTPARPSLEWPISSARSAAPRSSAIRIARRMLSRPRSKRLSHSSTPPSLHAGSAARQLAGVVDQTVFEERPLPHLVEPLCRVLANRLRRDSGRARRSRLLSSRDWRVSGSALATVSASSSVHPETTDSRRKASTLVREQLVAQSISRTQRLLAWISIPATLEEIKPAPEAFEQLFRREESRPRGSELQGQREIVQTTADSTTLDDRSTSLPRAAARSTKSRTPSSSRSGGTG